MVAASLLVAQPATAQTAITSITGGSQFTGFSTDETVGWQFRTGANALSVTKLGWWDQTPDTPLSASHHVGIWTLGGTLLGSVVVQTTSSIMNNFRFETVSPFTLLANTDYLIGGRDVISDGDNYASTSQVTTAADITLIGTARSANGTGFAAPTIVTVNGAGRFGPNFTYEPATVVPEPSSYVLLATGFAAFALVGRRRRSAR
jgi:hypothetical protein